MLLTFNVDGRHVVIGEKLDGLSNHAEIRSKAVLITVIDSLEVAGIRPDPQMIANLRPTPDVAGKRRVARTIGIVDGMDKAAAAGTETYGHVFGGFCDFGRLFGEGVRQSLNQNVRIIILYIVCNAVDKTYPRSRGTPFFRFNS